MNKTCSRCKQTRPLTAFWRHAGRSDGRHNVCRQCQYTPKLRLEWDGQYTRAQDALRTPYRAVCLSSGHQSRTVLLTRQQATLVSTAGLPRCPVCQSYRFLEPESELPCSRSAVKAHRASGLGAWEG